MQGCRQGCQAIIKEAAPLAVYIHCFNHRLNLAISSSCAVPIVRNAIGVVSRVTEFVRRSPKRIHKLQSLIDQIEDTSLARKKRIHSLCETRWVERHDTIQVFKELLCTIGDLLEFFVEEGDQVTAAEATTLLAALRTPDFIMGLVTASRGLAKTVGLSMALQSPTQHLGQALRRVHSIRNELASDRDTSAQAFEEATHLADAVGAGALIPRRSVGRQSTRSNAPAATPEEFFARNCFLPFLTT
jgi:hypothetical protein